MLIPVGAAKAVSTKEVTTTRDNSVPAVIAKNLEWRIWNLGDIYRIWFTQRGKIVAKQEKYVFKVI